MSIVRRQGVNCERIRFCDGVQRVERTDRFLVVLVEAMALHGGFKYVDAGLHRIWEDGEPPSQLLCWVSDRLLEQFKSEYRLCAT